MTQIYENCIMVNPALSTRGPGYYRKKGFMVLEVVSIISAAEFSGS